MIEAALNILRIIGSNSFLFADNHNAENEKLFKVSIDKRTKVIKSIVKLLEMVPQLNDITNDIIDSLFAIPDAPVTDSILFLDQVLGICDNSGKAEEKLATNVKFHIWCKMSAELSQWIVKHREQFKKLTEHEYNMLTQSLFKFLYRPLISYKIGIQVYINIYCYLTIFASFCACVSYKLHRQCIRALVHLPKINMVTENCILYVDHRE